MLQDSSRKNVQGLPRYWVATWFLASSRSCVWETLKRPAALLILKPVSLAIKTASASEITTEIRQQAEHPRAYEVALNGAKAMSEVVEKLADLHKKMDDMEREKPQQQVSQVQNNMFVGSTADLMKMLKENKRKH